MNQLNPLHIGALFLAILAYLFFTLSGVKTELNEAKLSYRESEEVAITLSSLKETYADKQATKQSLQRVLAQPSLKAANLETKETKTSTKISSKSMDTAALNSLMGKILNGSYNLSELKIKKLSETTAWVAMEIKW
jgi:hypothetical protein